MTDEKIQDDEMETPQKAKKSTKKKPAAEPLPGPDDPPKGEGILDDDVSANPSAGAELAEEPVPGPDDPPKGEGILEEDHPSEELPETSVQDDSTHEPAESEPQEDASEEPAESHAEVDEELVAAGAEWGLVDEEGNVRFKEGAEGPGRIVGKMRSNQPEKALGFFALKYRQITERVGALEAEIEAAPEKTRSIGKVRGLLRWVGKANALGDLPVLVARLEEMERICLAPLAENLLKKEELCAKAEALADSTEWKTAAEELKALQAEWKTIGAVPKEQAEGVWNRFRAACNRFFERRKEHFSTREKEAKEAIRRKTELCVKAEELRDTTDWRATTEAYKALQAEWKTIGGVPRAKGEELWTRFRAACDHFFARRSEHLEERERQRGEWKERLADAAQRKREQKQRLADSMVADEGHIERWRESIANIRPGGRADEIRTGLEEKIASVEERLAEKRARMAEMDQAILEIEAKL